MDSEAQRSVDRIDDFSDQSGRVLVTLSGEGQRDTETWLPLDRTVDVDQQHVDLGRRLHRLSKYRARKFLNGFAEAAHWQQHLAALRASVLASGFNAERLYFDACQKEMLVLDLAEQLSRLLNRAREAGFIDQGEVDALASGASIEVALDPRPVDVELGPPITGVIL